MAAQLGSAALCQESGALQDINMEEEEGTTSGKDSGHHIDSVDAFSGHNLMVNTSTGHDDTSSPSSDCHIMVPLVERTVRRVLVGRLSNVIYDPLSCRQVSEALAAEVMDALKALGLHRRKLVCVVSVGNLADCPGLQFGTRCLWDRHTDVYTSVKFTNTSLFAVALIYCLHY